MKCLPIRAHNDRDCPTTCLYCMRIVKRKDQRCTTKASLQTIKDHPFVEEVSDERKLDQGIWAYLQPGWYWDDPSLHIIHEDTFEEVMNCLLDIKVCQCHDCERLCEVGK